MIYCTTTTVVLFCANYSVWEPLLGALKVFSNGLLIIPMRNVLCIMLFWLSHLHWFRSGDIGQLTWVLQWVTPLNNTMHCMRYSLSCNKEYRICLINRPGVYYFRDPLKGGDYSRWAFIQTGALIYFNHVFTLNVLKMLE